MGSTMLLGSSKKYPCVFCALIEKKANVHIKMLFYYVTHNIIDYTAVIGGSVVGGTLVSTHLAYFR